MPATIVRWLDYTHKYGIAYVTSNNHLAVKFNDETTIIGSIKAIEQLTYMEKNHVCVEEGRPVGLQKCEKTDVKKV